MFKLNNDWASLLEEEMHKDYFKQLEEFLKEEYANQTIYPPQTDVLNALNYTSYQNARVVILGQDPYHGFGQAHGLCFSVKKGVNPPPSLKNIYKELQNDLNCTIPSHGELTKWAKQGVLMLNTVLTVREGKPNSHAKKGWETFTDCIIRKMNEKESPVVFLLWGRHAQQKAEFITNSKHLVLMCAHPSPFSARNGFFGCQHFSKTNEFLTQHQLKPIDWQID